MSTKAYRRAWTEGYLRLKGDTPFKCCFIELIYTIDRWKDILLLVVRHHVIDFWDYLNREQHLFIVMPYLMQP